MDCRRFQVKSRRDESDHYTLSSQIKIIYIHIYIYLFMVEKEDVIQLLAKKPDYLKTLKMAIEHEEEHSENEHYLGWEWHHVETHPATMIRLVTSGVAKINFKSNSATCYILKDKEIVKTALKEYEGN